MQMVATRRPGRECALHDFNIFIYIVASFQFSLSAFESKDRGLCDIIEVNYHNELYVVMIDKAKVKKINNTGKHFIFLAIEKRFTPQHRLIYKIGRAHV